MLSFRWTCGCCGKEFDNLPLDVGAMYPLDYFFIPEVERASRVRYAQNFCTIDGDSFYVRGCIEVPIIGRDDRFAWGVWVSVSEASWSTIRNTWSDPNRENQPPFFGWLNAVLKLYPDTLDLKTKLHLRPDSVPYTELEPTDHPLAREQRDGITIDRVIEIANAYVQHEPGAA